MSILQIDGFETENHSKKWTQTGFGSSTNDSNIKRSGNYAARLYNALGYSSTSIGIQMKMPTDSSIGIFGFGFRTDAYNMTSQWHKFFQAGEQDTQVFTLQYDANGRIAVANYNNVILGYSPPGYAISTGTQYYIQIKLVTHPINGEIKVYLGTDLIIDVTHINTSTNNNIVNQVKLMCNYTYSGNISPNVYFDDFYQVDGYGDVTDFLGICSVYGLKPQSVGTYDDFEIYGTTDYTQAVTEYDGNTNTYIWSATPDAKMSYHLNDVDTTGQIAAVLLKTYTARSTVGSGLGRYKMFVLDQSNNMFESNNFILNTSNFSYQHQVLEKNPITMDSWTNDDINNMQIGLKIIQTD